jgi:hypothetical protein
MAALSEAFALMSQSHDAQPSVSYSSREKESQLPAVVYPDNDMGHLEFRDVDGKLLRNLELHTVISPDIGYRVDGRGCVHFFSKISTPTKSYNVGGHVVTADFTRLQNPV